MKSLDGEWCEDAQTQLALHLVLLFYEIQGYNILLLGLSCQEKGKLSLSETWDFKLSLHSETPHFQYESIEEMQKLFSYLRTPRSG